MSEGTERKLQQLLGELRRVLNEIEATAEELSLDGNALDLPRAFDVPLTVGPGYFKGKKPLAVLFPGGRIVEAMTWKRVAKALLADCVSAPASREIMLYMRGKVFGRSRLLLAETPKGMDSPIHVAEGFYFESKFDTETLLRVITDLIFKPARYDFRGIKIRIRLAPRRP